MECANISGQIGMPSQPKTPINPPTAKAVYCSHDPD